VGSITIHNESGVQISFIEWIFFFVGSKFDN